MEDLYELYLENPSIKTDTRNLAVGDLFFALKGPNFNGNAFATQALAAGATYAIVDEKEYLDGHRTILVEDVLTSLQQLARHHRQTFNIPFLAITGSNGKTTTKELIHQVLSSTYKTYTTRGNLNNQIGIPLTILEVKRDAELAVIEMGANHLKEIESYCRYTLPTHGIITNIGKAHLEGFGSTEGVRKGKGELFDHIREHRGTVFVMWDYEYLREMSHEIDAIKYGTKEGQITGMVKRNDPYLEVEVTTGLDVKNIGTQLVGEYNLPNVLAAISVGNYFKIPGDAIKAAIEAYTPSNSRSQMVERGTNKIILDAYNANPSSMKSAIDNFAHLPCVEKILMLGGMAELGAESLQEHQAIIEQVSRFPWKHVILVGGDFLAVPHSYLSFTNSAEAGTWFRQQNLTNSCVLIKGSRSIRMEKILE